MKLTGPRSNRCYIRDVEDIGGYQCTVGVRRVCIATMRIGRITIFDIPTNAPYYELEIPTTPELEIPTTPELEIPNMP